MKKKYIKKGKCIWCLNQEPSVNFNNEPHTISKQLGANNIGFDICDSCNSYFGTRSKSDKYPMNVELAFKEIFNVAKHLLQNGNKEKLKSIYFSYFKSEGGFKIKRTFKFQRDFINMFTRQFKRGVYESFLQEYHLNTENGLDARFNRIRDFARYDKYDLPVYFVENDGVIMRSSDNEVPSFTFNEYQIKNIEEYGFFTIILFGFILYIEVTPKAELTREIFLRKESIKLRMPNPIATEIKKMRYITDIDFTFRKLMQG